MFFRKEDDTFREELCVFINAASDAVESLIYLDGAFTQAKAAGAEYVTVSAESEKCMCKVKIL